MLVPKGKVYFHLRSGTRKATGSYFTKPFAVEHLLTFALEPAIDAHHLVDVRRLTNAGATKSALGLAAHYDVGDMPQRGGTETVSADDISLPDLWRTVEAAARALR